MTMITNPRQACPEGSKCLSSPTCSHCPGLWSWKRYGTGHPFFLSPGRMKQWEKVLLHSLSCPARELRSKTPFALVSGPTNSLWSVWLWGSLASQWRGLHAPLPGSLEWAPWERGWWVWGLCVESETRLGWEGHAATAEVGPPGSLSGEGVGRHLERLGLSCF